MPNLMDPRASEFTLEGQRDDTVLIVHGFLDNPASYRYLARIINDRADWSVEVMRLPGHGTTPADLSETSRYEWLRAVRKRFDRLRNRSGRTVLLGSSMGGLLSYRIANQQPPDRLILLAPALGFAYRWYYVLPVDWWARTTGWLVDYVPRWPADSLMDPSREDELLLYDWIPASAVRELTELMKETREEVDPSRLQFPLLGLLAHRDRVVNTPVARQTLERAPNPANRVHVLKRTGHVLHLDYQRNRVADLIINSLDDCLIQ